VDRMLAKANDERQNQPQTMKENFETHPVIRTLYDHTDEVTCLEFHPKEAILLSGSADRTIKIFDYSKSSVKKAYKVIQVGIDYKLCTIDSRSTLLEGDVRVDFRS